MANADATNTETIAIEELITADERIYLFNKIKETLDEFEHHSGEKGINAILDTWIENKANLIKCFKKHPNYVPGKFMIAISNDYERTVDESGVAMCRFFSWLRECVVEKSMFVSNLPEDIKEQMIRDHTSCLPNEMYRAIYRSDSILKISTPTISSEQAENINQVFPFAHAREGQKTNKVIHKIFRYLRYDKHPDYNKEYAKYADSMSPMTIKRHTILSLNPIDYLKMSFGNSWASCHTIDQKNKREMPNSYQGAYCSGTISYMLDETSMVFYTVDADYDGDEFYDEPKITRQMFHWQRPTLVQGRLYPQDNDYNSESLYNQYRAIVQKFLSEMYDFGNLWNVKKGVREASFWIRSTGTHYRDYENYDNCTISLLSGEENNHDAMTVGHEPICVYCGRTHEHEGLLNCCGEIKICADCGREIATRRERVYETDGKYYCSDCSFTCAYCHKHHHGHGTETGTGAIVCDDCVREYYKKCPCCGKLYRESQTRPVKTKKGTEALCGDCLSFSTIFCSHCNTRILAKEALFLKNGLAVEKRCLKYCDKNLLTKAQLAIVEKLNNENEGE